MAAERLQKLIAHAGLASRREAEALILSGKVRVNGKVILTLGTSADLEVDTILVHNKPLPKPMSVTYALNKPRGVVSSTERQGKDKIITDLVPAYPRVYPVGRLDKDSEGLILLSNDGDLTLKLTHPSFEHEKEYSVRAKFQAPGLAKPDEWIATQLMKGVKLGDGMAKAVSAAVQSAPDGTVQLRITVQEGRNHLIRRMCATVGLDVRRLRRMRLGSLTLGKLQPGDYRILTERELATLT